MIDRRINVASRSWTWSRFCATTRVGRRSRRAGFPDPCGRPRLRL